MVIEGYIKDSSFDPLGGFAASLCYPCVTSRTSNALIPHRTTVPLVNTIMLPYLTDIQHPTEQTKIMRIAHQLYKAERELEGTTHWSYIRHDNPLDNLEYQATILDSIGADLRDIEGDIEELDDVGVRSVLTIWYSSIYRLFFDMFEEHNRIIEGAAD